MYTVTFEMLLSGLNQQSTHTTTLTWMLLIPHQLWLQGVTGFTQQHLG